MLEFDHVSYQYPGEDFDIIDQLSFRAAPGSFHCILGVSGCGKSTIFRLINGQLVPKGGEIRVGGAPIGGQKRYCGYMPQKDLLFPWRTVWENVALPLEIAGGLSKAQRRDRAEQALRDVGLEGCAAKLPRELSGGMRQRAAFARTMLAGSDLLLLDEPFSALDGFLKWQLEQELREVLERFPGPAVWVSHDRGEVYRNCSRVCVLEDGMSAPAASMAELMANPGTVAAARLSGCKNFAPVRPGPAPGLVEVPAWGLVLRAPWREGAAALGLRADRVRPEEAGAVNAFPCQVVRVTEDVSSVFAALRPEAASPGAPPLWMELAKDAWAALPDRERLWAAVRPEDLMLLK